MEHQIGKQIRTFRLRSNLTQEKLAEKLNVTAQTISKWENSLSYPDIMLLPELTAILGITMDELFESSMETHLRRIEQMLCGCRISDEDFAYAENQLKKGCLDMETRGRCLTLLADLYNEKAQGLLKQSAEYAKQALEIEPEKKANHSILNMASKANVWDWCCTNHNEIIDYYKRFVKEHPTYRSGYLWLLDNLIADGRLKEAEEALEAMKAVEETYHYLLYKGWIAQAGGDHPAAEACWDQMVETFRDSWFAWSSRADAYAKRADYDRAIENYKKAIELEQAPRYTDNYESIGQICVLKGDWAGAVDAYEHVIEILRSDWNQKEGDYITGIQQKISQLKLRMKEA
ncbi:MAG: helix-turn-helix domain-containing protein [Lachnospiraceae bacterium]|nr:helix-turn-helix domain-containing protein [Lachnospiraceae bacterium]